MPSSQAGGKELGTVPGLRPVTRMITLRPGLMGPLCPVGRAIGHQLSLPSLRGRRISREDVASSTGVLASRTPPSAVALPSCATNHLLCSALFLWRLNCPQGKNTLSSPRRRLACRPTSRHGDPLRMGRPHQSLRLLALLHPDSTRVQGTCLEAPGVSSVTHSDSGLHEAGAALTSCWMRS